MEANFLFRSPGFKKGFEYDVIFSFSQQGGCRNSLSSARIVDRA